MPVASQAPPLHIDRRLRRRLHVAASQLINSRYAAPEPVVFAIVQGNSLILPQDFLEWAR